MAKKEHFLRIIFGLKVKQRRQQLNLSFADLSKKSGVATSYLNEIEKGKKFPKEEKLRSLAIALETKVEALTNDSLPKSLKPLKFLFESNFLKEIPFDLFGLDLAKIIELLANAPDKVNAFISTLIELSQNFALGEHHFYLRAMRSYQEMNNNYFPEIEAEAERWRRMFLPERQSPFTTSELIAILAEHFDVEVIKNEIPNESKLSSIRSIYQPNKRKFILNERLNDEQVNLLLAKEIGFQVMGLEERPYSNSFFEIESFNQVLNNFKAGYFSVAFLVNKALLRKDIKAILNAPRWDGEALLRLVKKYEVAPETFFRRVNAIFQEDGFKDISFMRFSKSETGAIELDKELHLSQSKNPYALNNKEKYCRRWCGIKCLEQQTTSSMSLHAQISTFHESGEKYFVISIRKTNNELRAQPISVSFGFKINEESHPFFTFLNDASIPRETVNLTCERCSIMDCRDRVCPPTVLEFKQKRKDLIRDLSQIIHQK